MYNINIGKHYLKLLKLGKSLRRKPTNTKIKEYITYLEGRKSVHGSPNTWGSLREIYRQILEREDVDLFIDHEGNWYRTVGDNKTGTENMNFQIRRHNKVLNSVLEDKLPIVDLIVWTNVESIIEGIEYSSTKIIKVDQLVEFIEGYNEEVALSQEEIDFAIKSIERNKVNTSKVGI